MTSPRAPVASDQTKRLMMTPVGRLALVRTFPKSEMLAAMNFVVIPALIGPLLGPFTGGLIVHWLPWRMIFFVNLPIGLLGLWLIKQHMPDYRGLSRCCPPPCSGGSGPTTGTMSATGPLRRKRPRRRSGKRAQAPVESRLIN